MPTKQKPTQAKAQPIHLMESVFGKPTAIDKEAGVISGVKILGIHSRNKGGYEYSQQALQEAAECYEGIKVNTDHPDRKTPNAARSVTEGIGWLKNCRVVEGEGVYGDLHVLKSHPMANLLFEAAERNPKHMGLSHNADGHAVNRGGKRIIESVEKVRSVDLVGNPATNDTLFEGVYENEGDTPVKTKTLKAILEDLPKGGAHRKAIVALMEMDGMADMGPDTAIAMPADVESPSADQATRSAFKAAIDAILDDESLSWADTQAKIKELVGMLAKMSGGDPATETPAEGEGEAAVTESLQEQLTELKAELASEKADKANRALLESKQITVTDKRLAILKAVTDKGAREELLEDWVKVSKPETVVQRSQKPTRSTPLVESSEVAGGYQSALPYKDVKEFARLVR